MIHTTPSIVRTAKPMDAPEIWRLFLQVHRENGLFALAPHKVTVMMDRALHPEAIPATDTGPRARIGVIGNPGKLEAIAFIMISTIWYTDELHLDDLALYVDPECRHSNHAKACLDWMKKLSNDLQIPLMTGVVSKQRTAAKIRLYDRMLPRIGAFYLYPRTDDSELIKPETVMGSARRVA
jgi:hypothetical protein